MFYILPDRQIRAGMASVCVFFGLATLSHIVNFLVKSRTTFYMIFQCRFSLNTISDI